MKQPYLKTSVAETRTGKKTPYYQTLQKKYSISTKIFLSMQDDTEINAREVVILLEELFFFFLLPPLWQRFFYNNCKSYDKGKDKQSLNQQFACEPPSHTEHVH